MNFFEIGAVIAAAIGIFAIYKIIECRSKRIHDLECRITELEQVIRGKRHRHSTILEAENVTAELMALEFDIAELQTRTIQALDKLDSAIKCANRLRKE